MKNGYKHIWLIAFVALVAAVDIMAQDTTMSTTKIQAAYYKDQNGQKRIVAKLLIKKERYEPFANMEVQFFAVSDTSKILLEKIITDAKGEAVYLLQDQDKSYAGPAGQSAFEVMYEGNPDAKSAVKDIEVKAADLKVSFFQEDTSKFIAIEAFEVSSADSLTPIAGIEIGLFIKGMFSYLSLVKDVTGTDGKLIVPFPRDMPGDTLGVITIAAKIEDNDVYGNVESWGKINWARPVPLVVEAKRGLGDTDAPLWMVYTLIVLLSTVWLHYTYVIFLVIKIKLAKHLM
ncbi:MAG: hypothetical protein WAT91_11195 [Saprospiraceae bacterium]